MKKIFGSLEGGSVERQEKKKFTVTLIYATIVLIVCLLITLLVAQVVASVKAKKAAETEPADDGTNSNYVALTVDAAKLDTGSLILVNKNNEYIFANNPEVVPFPNIKDIPYDLVYDTLKVNPTALAAFNDMMKGLYKNVSDANIVVTEAYRSYDNQASKHEKNPSQAFPAGYSDFHTGLSFSLKDGDTDAKVDNASLNGKYDWLYENAHKYGFVVRYPANIPESDTGKNAGKNFSAITGVDDYAYVFRYVGIPHATYMYQNELCLEEYLELIRTNHQYGTSSLSIKGGDSRSYEVYYIAATGENTELQVPSKYTYEISGDNMNGYIVTVCKSRINKD